MKRTLKENPHCGKSKAPDLIGDIVKGRWNAKQLSAIAFLANPQGGSQEELANKLGVTRSTVSDWKRLPGFMEDVHRVAATFFLEADLAVDRATLRDALKDISQHKGIARAIIKSRELYYRRRGLLVDHTTHLIEGDNPIEVIIHPPGEWSGGKDKR